MTVTKLLSIMFCLPKYPHAIKAKKLHLSELKYGLYAFFLVQFGVTANVHNIPELNELNPCIQRSAMLIKQSALCVKSVIYSRTPATTRR